MEQQSTKCWSNSLGQAASAVGMVREGRKNAYYPNGGRLECFGDSDFSILSTSLSMAQSIQKVIRQITDTVME